MCTHIFIYIHVYLKLLLTEQVPKGKKYTPTHCFMYIIRKIHSRKNVFQCWDIIDDNISTPCVYMYMHNRILYENEWKIKKIVYNGKGMKNEIIICNLLDSLEKFYFPFFHISFPSIILHTYTYPFIWYMYIFV